MSDNPSPDLIIVGGGLAGGLLAAALRARRPELKLLLIEGAQTLGGNHLWSFFDTDVPGPALDLLAPFVTHRWDAGHDVRFPARSRGFATPYNSIASTDFDRLLREMLGDALLVGAVAAHVAPDSVRLADGRHLAARAVIDARGFIFNLSGTISNSGHSPDRDPRVYGLKIMHSTLDPAYPFAGSNFSAADTALSALRCGWQKFVGMTLLLPRPHGLDRPIIMDAAVPQIDGYRFVYSLPFDTRRVFVEDTYYSDGPDLDASALRERILSYADAMGWHDAQVEHEEQGVLPVVHGGNFDAFWPAEDPVARCGVRAGLFHPMTGYSLPAAARFALWLAELDWTDGADLARRTRAYAKAHWRAGGYYRLLGKMLFRAAQPDERYLVFQRFYGLSDRLIARFYAGDTGIWDRFRILCGRPPVPIRAAVRAIMQPED